MKKKIVTIALSSIIVVVIAVAVYFAYFRVDAKALANKNISEQDKVCYYANNGSSQVKLISGTREEPYVLNGVSENLKDFALIIFRCSDSSVEAPTFVANINDKSYNGILQNNPYDNTFVVDLETEVQEGASINVKITINDTTTSYDLVSKSADWQIDYNRATEIAIDYFLDKIKENSSYKGLNAELYIRIISDVSNSFDDYFYHATLTLPDSQSYSVVIDVNTGNIIQK